MMDYKRLEMVEEVYQLCNKNQYFTCGTVAQYNKMFDMIREGKPIHEIALVIYICSNFEDSNISLEKIEDELNAIAEQIKNSEV